MKEVKFTCNIPVEESTKLRDYDYEKITRQNVIAALITSQGDTSSPTYQKYHDELIAVTAKADLSRQAIYDKYVPDEYKGRGEYSWELDYNTGTLKVGY